MDPDTQIDLVQVFNTLGYRNVSLKKQVYQFYIQNNLLKKEIQGLIDADNKLRSCDNGQLLEEEQQKEEQFSQFTQLEELIKQKKVKKKDKLNQKFKFDRINKFYKQQQQLKQQPQQPQQPSQQKQQQSPEQLPQITPNQSPQQQPQQQPSQKQLKQPPKLTIKSILKKEKQVTKKQVELKTIEKDPLEQQTQTSINSARSELSLNSGLELENRRQKKDKRPKVQFKIPEKTHEPRSKSQNSAQQSVIQSGSVNLAPKKMSEPTSDGQKKIRTSDEISRASKHQVLEKKQNNSDQEIQPSNRSESGLLTSQQTIGSKNDHRVLKTIERFGQNCDQDQGRDPHLVKDQDRGRDHDRSRSLDRVQNKNRSKNKSQILENNQEQKIDKNVNVNLNLNLNMNKDQKERDHSHNELLEKKKHAKMIEMQQLIKELEMDKIKCYQVLQKQKMQQEENMRMKKQSYDINLDSPVLQMQYFSPNTLEDYSGKEPSKRETIIDLTNE